VQDAGAAGHVIVGDQGVEDGFFGGLHHRGVEGVQVSPRDEPQLVVPAFGTGAEDRDAGGDPSRAGGGKGQEQVSGEVEPVVPVRARPRVTRRVLVIATGPEKLPDSEIQLTPVSSPLPFWEKNPAATGSPAPAWPRG